MNANRPGEDERAGLPDVPPDFEQHKHWFHALPFAQYISLGAAAICSLLGLALIARIVFFD